MAVAQRNVGNLRANVDWTFFYCVLATLGFALALGLIIVCPKWESAVLWLLGGLLSSPIWLNLCKRVKNWLVQSDLFSPLVAFPIAYVAWFVIGSINFIDLPHSISFGAFDPIPLRVPAYAAIGLVGYLTGVKLALRPYRVWPLRKFLQFRNAWRRMSTVLAGLAVAMLFAYLDIVGHIGVPVLSPDAARARLEIEKYHLAATLFSLSAYTVFLFFMVRFWTDRGHGSFARRLSFIGGAAIVAVLLLSLSSRSAFFIVALTALILYNYLRKPLRVGKVLLILVALFALLGVYGYLRDLTVKSNMPQLLASAGVPRAIQPYVYCYLYIRYPVATLADVSRVIPNQVPYQDGAITLLPFTSFLPGHHEMSDMYFKNLLGNSFVGAGQPATALGPFYADFGAVGIFVGMLGFGLLLARIYRWMVRERTAFSVLIFAWVTQVGLFGLFAGIFTYLGTLLLPLGWFALNRFMRQGRTPVTKQYLPGTGRFGSPNPSPS